MKILFIIPSLSSGGAERVISMIANALSGDGTKVAIMTLVGDAVPDSYHLEKNVERIRVNLMNISRIPVIRHVVFLLSCYEIHKIIKTEGPAVLVAFMDVTNIIAVIIAKTTKTPIIISERNDPSKKFLKNPWRFLRKRTYHLADLIIAQTQYVEEWIRSNCGGNIVTIGNPLPILEAKIATPEKVKKFLSIGRLHEQKGYDVLLEAFYNAQRAVPGLSLRIVGEGKLRNELESQIKRLGLTSSVKILPPTDSIHKYYKWADVYVTASRWEGIPNTIIEALCFGLPVITTDSGPGVRSLIQDGQNGLLVGVDDAEQLAKIMRNIVESKHLKTTLEAGAREWYRANINSNPLHEWINQIKRIAGTQ